MAVVSLTEWEIFGVVLGSLVLLALIIACCSYLCCGGQAGVASQEFHASQPIIHDDVELGLGMGMLAGAALIGLAGAAATVASGVMAGSSSSSPTFQTGEGGCGMSGSFDSSQNISNWRRRVRWHHNPLSRVDTPLSGLTTLRMKTEDFHH